MTPPTPIGDAAPAEVHKPRASLRDWEAGDYLCKCSKCGLPFFGPKALRVCVVCYGRAQIAATDAKATPAPFDEAAAVRRAEEAKARADAASSPPWIKRRFKGSDDGWHDSIHGSSFQALQVATVPVGKPAAHPEGEANGVFVVHARTDVPSLASDVLAAVEEVRRLKNIIRGFVHWPSPNTAEGIEDQQDLMRRARAALALTPEKP